MKEIAETKIGKKVEKAVVSGGVLPLPLFY